MTEDAVTTMLDALAGFDLWIGGGWGVDALVGHQTRPHDDLGVVLPDVAKPKRPAGK